MNFPASTQQEFMNEIVKLGAPVRPVDVQGKIEFNSQFFEPHGSFHARIYYPAKYADMDLTISHPVGRWQIDEIAFIPQQQQARDLHPPLHLRLQLPLRRKRHLPLQASLHRKLHRQLQPHPALEVKRIQRRASHREAATAIGGRANRDKSATTFPSFRGGPTIRPLPEMSDL